MKLMFLTRLLPQEHQVHKCLVKDPSPSQLREVDDKIQQVAKSHTAILFKPMEYAKNPESFLSLQQAQSWR